MSYFLFQQTHRFLTKWNTVESLSVRRLALRLEPVGRRRYGEEDTFYSSLPTKTLAMMRTSKKRNSFWTSIIYPNKYPAHSIPNYSLAKTASTLAIWIPSYSTQKNVNYVFKDEPNKTVGGEDLSSSGNGRDMKGTGKRSPAEEALRHPIKVCTKNNNSFVLFPFFRFLELN